MANHKSAKKRALQTVKKTERNKARKSEVKSAMKKIRQAIEAKDRTKAGELLPQVQKLIGKLWNAGIIKKNTAARSTSRLAQQVKKLS